MPRPEPLAQSLKPFITYALFWSLVPAALFPHWFVFLLASLAFLALTRSFTSLLVLLTLGFLNLYGAMGLGAAAFLFAAWGGRISVLELAGVTGLAWGLSGLNPACVVLAVGLLASLGTGLWRRWFPDLELSLPKWPKVDAGCVIVAGLAVGALLMAFLSLGMLTRYTLDVFSEPRPGRVLFSRAVPPEDTEATSRYWLDVRYEYPDGSRTVQHTTRVGGVTRSEDEARKWVAAHPAGTAVTVWARPGGSTLWHEVDNDDLMLILVCGLLGWIPIVGFVAGWRRMGTLTGWWLVCVLVSWPIIALAGNISPLYWVGGFFGVWFVHYDLQLTAAGR